MMSDRRFARRIGRLFALYGEWTLGGMLLLLMCYVIWAAASWFVGIPIGRLAELELIGAVCTVAVVAEIVAVGVILAGRWRIRVDFSVFGHSMHFDFGERDRPPGRRPG